MYILQKCSLKKKRVKQYFFNKNILAFIINLLCWPTYISIIICVYYVIKLVKVLFSRVTRTKTLFDYDKISCDFKEFIGEIVKYDIRAEENDLFNEKLSSTIL